MSENVTTVVDHDSDPVDAGSTGVADENSPTNGGLSRHELLVAEGDAAGDYLERLLDILDFDGDIDLDVEGERAVVSIIGEGDVDRLVGDHGEVLDALQELTRLAAMAETGQRSRLMLDIAGYRARRRAELSELGRTTAETVASTGEAVRLAPMNPFERKVVHDAVGLVEGVSSSSEGEEPQRRVVMCDSLGGSRWVVRAGWFALGGSGGSSVPRKINIRGPLRLRHDLGGPEPLINPALSGGCGAAGPVHAPEPSTAGGDSPTGGSAVRGAGDEGGAGRAEPMLGNPLESAG